MSLIDTDTVMAQRSNFHYAVGVKFVNLVGLFNYLIDFVNMYQNMWWIGQTSGVSNEQ